MTSKTIIAGLVAITIVTTLMTGNMTYAASNAQGQPFQELDKRITTIEENNRQ